MGFILMVPLANGVCFNGQTTMILHFNGPFRKGVCFNGPNSRMVEREREGEREREREREDRERERAREE